MQASDIYISSFELTKFIDCAKKYYHALNAPLLVLDPHTIEQNRTERVNKNFTQKREEKGLITVFESANETDNNRTTTGLKDTKVKAQKTLYSTMGAAGVISEETDHGAEDDKGNLLLIFRVGLHSPRIPYQCR